MSILTDSGEDWQRDAANAEAAYQRWVKDGSDVFADQKDNFIAGWRAAVAWYLEDE